jgi:hypothetical protein
MSAGATPLVQGVERKILLVRGHKVLLDADLAAVYGVETRALNQAVKRNPERFPRGARADRASASRPSSNQRSSNPRSA